jgi:hypothetical protein
MPSPFVILTDGEDDPTDFVPILESEVTDE